MKWYCEKCATIHDDNELCPKIILQLKNNKDLLGEAASFTTVAGEHNLITSNNMNKILKPISNLSNSDLTYEGSYQLTREEYPIYIMKVIYLMEMLLGLMVKQ